MSPRNKDLDMPCLTPGDLVAGRGSGVRGGLVLEAPPEPPHKQYCLVLWPSGDLKMCWGPGLRLEARLQELT